MAERIQLMEAEAEAGAELAGELSGDTLESKFRQLEAGGGARGRALAELKAKMGLPAAPEARAALPGKARGAGAEESSEAPAGKLDK